MATDNATPTSHVYTLPRGTPTACSGAQGRSSPLCNEQWVAFQSCNMLLYTLTSALEDQIRKIISPPSQSPQRKSSKVQPHYPSPHSAGYFTSQNRGKNFLVASNSGKQGYQYSDLYGTWMHLTSRFLYHFILVNYIPVVSSEGPFLKNKMMEKRWEQQLGGKLVRCGFSSPLHPQPQRGWLSSKYHLEYPANTVNNPKAQGEKKGRKEGRNHGSLG